MNWLKLKKQHYFKEPVEFIYTSELFDRLEYDALYENQNDLLEKLNYYSKNYENEGIKIANNGYQIIKNKYRPMHVWPKIFKNL